MHSLVHTTTQLMKSYQTMKLWLISTLILVLMAITTFGDGHRRQGRRGRGLDRCKPFIKGCSFRRHGEVNQRPLYVIENFDENEVKCSKYMPTDPADIDVEDPHDTVEQFCATAEPGAEIRMCVLRKKHMKKLMKDQELEEDEMEDLDFNNSTLAGLKFRGKCLVCPTNE